MQNLGKIVPVMSNLVFMANSPTRQGLFSRRRYIYLRHFRVINIILALTLLECIWGMLR